tara:strand:- start:324 stop:593 length:270 start_codon:yes stop_codon:yes gene_type:complete
MDRETWEERYPDRPYMTDEEGYEIDSRSDAGGPTRGQNPRISTELSANEKWRRKNRGGASNTATPDTGSMTGNQRRQIKGKKSLISGGG